MSEKNNVRPFGFKDKIGYMFGDFGNDFTFILSSSFMLKFYTDVMGIHAAVVRCWCVNDGCKICGCLHGCCNGPDCRPF